MRPRLFVTAIVTAAVLVAGPPAQAQAPNSKWQATIDSMWGPGLPTDQKLQVFDTFWNTIDQQYAGFPDSRDNWVQLRDRYRPEVAAGVSRGRFAAIMGQFTLALRDGHTFAFDLGVVQATRDPLPGVPVFIIRGRPMNTSFGACVTALADGSALVYNVAPGHPLGLAPGDRVLGYDGRPWREESRELLRAQLPVRGNLPGNRSTARHYLVQSVAVNWHLFTTIDIHKHDTGRVVQLPTAALNTSPPLTSPVCSEGLSQPGVPDPATSTTGAGNTWGTITGTNIGYIHLVSEDVTGGARFAQAVSELAQTDGLIIDERVNTGGMFVNTDTALDMLFDGPLPGIGLAERADPADHFALREFAEDTGGPPDTVDYQHPIAVLTGPSTASAGEYVALRLSMHPRARIFGKPTGGLFSFITGLPLDLGQPGWIAQFAPYNGFLLDRPNDYLDHSELQIDEPAWLTPDDVARGKDTVADAALGWIDRANACPDHRRSPHC